MLDCEDLETAAQFWCAALGYDMPHPQSGPYLQLVAEHRGGIELLLQKTTDSKLPKNRVHLDLRTRDLDTEVQRLINLGSKVVTEDLLIEHDWRWHILTDPDGNEL